MDILGRRVKVVGLALIMLIGIFASLAPSVAAVDWIKQDLGNVGGAVYSVATGDGDNDGTDEVYAASENGGAFQVKQDKDTPKDWDISTVGYGEGSNYQMRAVIVGDGRDSGKNGVYAGGGTYGGSWTGKMYEFLWDAQDKEWDKLQMGTGGYLIWDVALGDGDKDDRNEVYAASYDGRVYEYSYANGWNAKDIGYTTYYQRGVAVGDGDNDGDIEVYSAGGYWQYKEVFKYEYNTASSTWQQTSLGDPNYDPGTLTDIAIGDGDNDGKNELYVTDYSYVYQVKWNSGSSTWGWTTIFTNMYTYQNHVEVGDGDADGKNEVYVASANDQIYRLAYASGSWGMESVGSGNGDMNGVYIGNGDNFGNQVEVYAGCSDSHVYQFLVDKTPPPNPIVTSPTHKPGVWSNNNDVKVNWRMPPDPSGIDGYSFVWDSSDSTIPDNTKDVEETVSGTNSGPLADGNGYYFHIKARDNALNWNPGATHFGPLKIDTVPPKDIGLDINSGAQYTNNRYVTLTASGTDERSGMGFMSFSNNGAIWPAQPESWNTSRENWDLTDLDAGGNDNDGLKTVSMKAFDMAMNEANGLANDTIFLDRAKPVGLSIVINGGDQYTNKADVTLNLSASDPDPASGMFQMRFSNDGVNWSSWESWNNIRSGWSLTADAGGTDVDGTKTVHFKVRDKAGNVAGPMSDTIILDRGIPGSVSIVIDGGAQYTNKTNVKLDVSATDPSPGTGVEKMQFSNDNTVWSSWEDYTTSKNPWSLTEGSGGVDKDGEKAVYFKVKDMVGNLGGPVKDTIFLDRAKPISLKLTINDGASLTNKLDVTLKLDATDPDPASGLDQMQLRSGAGAWGAWEAWTTTRSYTLSSGDGTKTISFRVKDKAGNIAGPASDSIVLDTTPPTITNIKVIGITDRSAVVTWSTDSPADSKVEYGLDINYGSTGYDGDLVTEHSVTLTGLTPETLYHFRVYSKDEVGNGPTVSDDHTFRTKATPDTTPPIINNLRVEGITDTFAIVLWDTNEASDSFVHYGETMDYGYLVGTKANVQKHAVELTGLKPDTVYYFKVQSTDASGNGPVEDTGQFRTLVTPDVIPPVISNVQVSGITNTMAVITWLTDEVADGIVEYGTTTDYGTVTNDPSYVREHMVTLTGLAPSTTYYFIVRSTDPSGNGPTTSAQYTFMTVASPDTVPPSISNVMASGITNTKAVITWNTDELADSIVEFGMSADYGDTAEDVIYVLTHSITLTGLKPSTQYHFRVLSSDLSGNGPSKSKDYTFTTTSIEDKEPPIIQWVKIEGIRSNVAVVLWKTNEPANSIVEFGLDMNYTLTSRDDAFVLDHSIVLKDLNASTTYHLRVSSTDVSGNGPTYSNDYMFTTEALVDTVPPTISDVKVTNITESSVTITWKTNEPGSTKIGYGTNGTVGTPIGDDGRFITDHKFDLQDLEPGTAYTFVIYSTDPSGNMGNSMMLNFTTLKKSSPPPPPPGPGPNPFIGDEGLWWLWVVLLIVIIAIISVGAFWAYSRRKGPPAKAAARPPRGGPRGRAAADVEEDTYEVEELDMEDDVEDLGELDMMADGDVEDMGTLDMGSDEDIEDLGMEEEEDADWDLPDDEVIDDMDDLEDKDLQLGAAITAVTSGAAATRPVKAAPAKREPVKKVKCPGCRSEIPIYSETQTDIKCPNCGKEGRIKPMRPPTASSPERAAAVSPLSKVLYSDEGIVPAAGARPTGPAARAAAPRAATPRTRAPPSRAKAGVKKEAEPMKKPLKTMTCSGCGGKVPVYTSKRPVRITCPGCGKAGTLKK